MKSTRRLSLFSFMHDASKRWIEGMAFSPSERSGL